MRLHQLNLVLSTKELDELGAAAPLLPGWVGERLDLLLQARSIRLHPTLPGKGSIPGKRCVFQFREEVFVRMHPVETDEYGIDVTGIVDRWLSGLEEGELDEIIEQGSINAIFNRHPAIAAFGDAVCGTRVDWEVVAEGGLRTYLGLG